MELSSIEIVLRTGTLFDDEDEVLTQHPTCWFDDGDVVVYSEETKIAVCFHREPIAAISQSFRNLLNLMLEVPEHQRSSAFGQPSICVDCTIEDVVLLVGLADDPRNQYVLAGGNKLLVQARHFLHVMAVWEVDRSRFSVALLHALHRDWPVSLSDWDVNIDRVASGPRHSWPNALPMLQFALQNRALLRPLVPPLCYRVVYTVSLPDIILLQDAKIRELLWLGHARITTRVQQARNDFTTMAGPSLCCVTADNAQQLFGPCGVDLLGGLRRLGQRVETSTTFCARCNTRVWKWVEEQRQQAWNSLSGVFETNIIFDT
ncbi:hypothetical protein AURDEDRAFT_158914 [Auricularia subglabra TFB-10046 SS5]|nr:hypothetical protein AURDEDRAFT_158914 [Auricularia subglabra TFB-10046 SS5]